MSSSKRVLELAYQYTTYIAELTCGLNQRSLTLNGKEELPHSVSSSTIVSSLPIPIPSHPHPHRFTAEEKAKRHPFAHLPFGVGPRGCIGMRFAVMEAKMAMIDILENFRIVRAPETQACGMVLPTRTHREEKRHFTPSLC